MQGRGLPALFDASNNQAFRHLRGA